jgi:fructokinase
MIPSPARPDVVCYGEILWDILPDKSLPGGAPMNVAYHLKKLGAHPALITRIGKDGYGKELVDLLSQSGITTDYVQEDDRHSTGLVHARLKEHNEMVYDIVQPVAWDFIEWEDPFYQLVQQAKYFVYGSLTSRNQVSRATLYRLLDLANTKVLDINLRPPHFSQSSVEQLLEKTDMLKMNEAELALISGWYSQLEKEEDRMKLLQDRFNIETVIVTMGGEGAMLLDKGAISRHRGYQVQVADTIGSGDAFLAGLLSQFIQQKAPEEALNYACGLGALIATYQGACPEYETSEITGLINANAHQKVQSHL